MQNKISSTEFINEKIMFGGDIKEAEEVRNFALLWNMFELLILQELSEIKKIEELVELSDEDEVEKIFLCFKERYGKEGKFSIEDLYLEQGHKNEVLRLINSNLDDIEDKLYVVYHIIRRIRNNFFHGRKEFYELSRSEDLFKHINLFLIPYIEKAYNEKYC